MANVFADLKATKNSSTRLILLDDSSVELSTLPIVVSQKIRLRRFRATDKRRKLRKIIKIRGRYTPKASVKKRMVLAEPSMWQLSTSQVNGKNFDVNVPDNKNATSSYPDS